MELQLRIIGALLIILAMVHLIFPRYFQWKQQLKSLTIINRQMMYVHSYFIAFIVFLIGLLYLTSSHELLTTPLGKRVTLGLGIFWIARLAVQFFGYSPKIWKGKPFETTMHILFSLFWTYISTIFILTYLS